MSKSTDTTKTTTESKLSKFNLGFEFDRSWRDVRKEVELRTVK